MILSDFKLKPGAAAAFALAGLLAATAGAQQDAADGAGQQAQQAQALAPIALEGDPKRGKQLAYTCQGCHGVPGARNAYPSYRVPKLGGQNADYIEIALQGYRQGTRDHATMEAQAGPMDDQQIADIAAYFASVEDAPETGKSDASLAQIRAGRERATACVPCHGEAGVAQAPQWPNLAGQHASYIEEAIKQYQSGERVDLVMAPMIANLDDAAIAELAGYFAAQRGLYVTDD